MSSCHNIIIEKSSKESPILCFFSENYMSTGFIYSHPIWSIYSNDEDQSLKEDDLNEQNCILLDKIKSNTLELYSCGKITFCARRYNWNYQKDKKTIVVTEEKSFVITSNSNSIFIGNKEYSTPIELRTNSNSFVNLKY